MKTALRLLCVAFAAALGLSLTACATNDTTGSAVASTAGTRAPTTYRPIGSNVPVATPAAEMSDNDRQRLSNSLGARTNGGGSG